MRLLIDFFSFPIEIQKSINEIKKELEPKLLGPAFTFLSYEKRTQVARRLLQNVSEKKLNSVGEYRRYFDFGFRDQLLTDAAGLGKTLISELCWDHCKNACLSISASYVKNLGLSTAIGDLLMSAIFRNNKLRCEKADRLKEYPDYKLIFQDRTLAYIDFKYRAVPYFFIDKEPYNLLCYYSVAEDIAKIKEHYGQMQRTQMRGAVLHPTYHLYFVDYPCISCIVFQNVGILQAIMSKSGRTRSRRNVWTKRISRRREASMFTYFSLLTDLREVSDLVKAVHSISDVEDFEYYASSLERQDIDVVSRLYREDS